MKATRHDPFALGDKTRWFFTAVALFLAAPPTTLRGTSIAYSHGDPTNFEQYQLELVNAARAKPSKEASRLGIDLNKNLTPGRISSAPKQPLAFHPRLLQVARGHSDWMLNTGNFSHTGLNGSTPTKRAAAKSYNFSVAENIAYLSTSETPNLNSYTIQTHENLFKSPSHRPNLMDPSFSIVGLGLREGLFYDQDSQKKLNTLMVTQNFSSGGNSTDSGPFLVGVVYKDLNKSGAYDPGEGIPGVRVEPDFGGYHAVTSQSGGYAVPLPPMETRDEDVSIPLAVKSTPWDKVRPHDQKYREFKISEAPEIEIGITWSGGAIAHAVKTIVKIRKPTRINYKLIGADNFHYKKTMVSSLNVKADYNLANPPPRITSQPRKMAVAAGSKTRFSVTATGIKLTYQWNKNGSAIK
ncbi:MAG: CAP domain-containing protein, partial [Verrucomicrobiota bacterium]